MLTETHRTPAQMLLPVLLLVTAAAFEVQTPQKSILGIYGQPATLSCLYSPPSPLADLIVTWQRVGGNQVVHSFYYSADQLERQDGAYHGRTTLFQNELAHGNASLRLDPIQAGDSGEYLCSVSSKVGTGDARVQVTIAAFYREPKLTIWRNLTNITLQYETRGYPLATVNWIVWHGTILVPPKTHIVEDSDGLWHLRSDVTFDPKTGANYTFTLTNELLDQVINRTVAFNNDDLGEPSCPNHNIPLIILVVILVITVVVLMSVLLKDRRRAKKDLHR